jgi:hypothetical protein
MLNIELNVIAVVKQLFGEKNKFLHTILQTICSQFKKKIAYCNKQFVKHFTARMKNLVRHFTINSLEKKSQKACKFPANCV